MVPPAQLSELSDVFKNAVNAIFAIAGIVLFVLLVSGGFKFITSGGDPKAVDAAKKTLTYAIAGLVVILVSYLILVLIKTLTGANVTDFNLTI